MTPTAMEQCLLGAMLDQPGRVIPDALEIGLREDDFGIRRHAVIYRAIRRRWDRGEGLDFILLHAELQNAGTLEDAGGPDYLEELTRAAAVVDNARGYAHQIREAALLRGIARACHDTLAELEEPEGRTGGELLEDAEARLLDVAGDPRGVDDGGRAGETLEAVLERLERRQRGETTGMGTGFPDLDRMTDGLEGGQLVIAAGRPSMGKTSWVTNVVQHVALRTAVPTALYSLEQGREEIGGRMLGAEARVDLHARLREEDFARLAEAATRIRRAPLFIYDRPFSNVLALRAHARRMHRRERLGLIAVDYLQLMGGDGASRNEEVGEISRGLKALARELDVPVITLSQLSRACEQRQNKRPILSDLRDSGSLEQDADVVLFLFRPEYYLSRTEALTQGLRGHAELIVAKQRNGPTGTIPLYFEEAYTRFDSVERGQDERRAS